jgi:hypothetical protein
MITFDTHAARFISNIRHCDEIPLVSTVTNIAHMIFKTAQFFCPQQDEKKSLYSKYVQEGSFLLFAIRAIPLIGQIFNTFEQLYHTRKIHNEGYRPPIASTTSALGDTYIFKVASSGELDKLTEKPSEYITKKKLDAVASVFMKKEDYIGLEKIIYSVDPKFISQDLKEKFLGNEEKLGVFLFKYDAHDEAIKRICDYFGDLARREKIQKEEQPSPKIVRSIDEDPESPVAKNVFFEDEWSPASGSHPITPSTPSAYFDL